MSTKIIQIPRIALVADTAAAKETDTVAPGTAAGNSAALTAISKSPVPTEQDFVRAITELYFTENFLHERPGGSNLIGHYMSQLISTDLDEFLEISASRANLKQVIGDKLSSSVSSSGLEAAAKHLGVTITPQVRAMLSKGSQLVKSGHGQKVQIDMVINFAQHYATVYKFLENLFRDVGQDYFRSNIYPTLQPALITDLLGHRKAEPKSKPGVKRSVKEQALRTAANKDKDKITTYLREIFYPAILEFAEEHKSESAKAFAGTRLTRP